MTTATIAEAIERAAATANFGAAWARKTGRDARRPYVPILLVPNNQVPVSDHDTHEEQLMGRAFATRAQAIDYCERHIRAARRDLALKLAEPRHRALREHYGLPRELPA